MYLAKVIQPGECKRLRIEPHISKPNPGAGFGATYGADRACAIASSGCQGTHGLCQFPWQNLTHHCFVFYIKTWSNCLARAFCQHKVLERVKLEWSRIFLNFNVFQLPQKTSGSVVWKLRNLRFLWESDEISTGCCPYNPTMQILHPVSGEPYPWTPDGDSLCLAVRVWVNFPWQN